MPLADYAHWNEDAERVWWEEEGKHADEPRDPYYDDPYEYSARMDAADAYAEELAEIEDDVELMDMLGDDRLTPQMRYVVEQEIKRRGVTLA